MDAEQCKGIVSTVENVHRIPSRMVSFLALRHVNVGQTYPEASKETCSTGVHTTVKPDHADISSFVLGEH